MNHAKPLFFRLYIKRYGLFLSCNSYSIVKLQFLTNDYYCYLYFDPVTNIIPIVFRPDKDIILFQSVSRIVLFRYYFMDLQTMKKHIFNHSFLENTSNQNVAIEFLFQARRYDLQDEDMLYWQKYVF